LFGGIDLYLDVALFRLQYGPKLDPGDDWRDILMEGDISVKLPDMGFHQGFTGLASGLFDFGCHGSRDLLLNQDFLSLNDILGFLFGLDRAIPLIAAEE